MVAGVCSRRVPAGILCVFLFFLLLLLPVAAQQGEEVRWEGDVVVDGAFTVAEGTILTVAPGTHVQGQGQVIVHGVVHVEGTPERPVQWTPNLVVDHVGQEQSILRGAVFAGYGTDGLCRVRLSQGSLAIHESRFEGTNRAVCTAGHTRLDVAHSLFALNGFSFFPERPESTLMECEGHPDRGGEVCQTHTTQGGEGEPGTWGSCWAHEGGGWICRWWGGSMAVGIDTGAEATIRNNTFHQNRVGVMTGLGDIRIHGNTFRDNDHGVEVWAQGPIIGTPGQTLLDPLVIRDNLFLHHGDPNHTPPSPGLRSGIQIHGDLDPPIKPNPDDIRILLHQNTFQNGSVGVHVEGWRPTVGLVENDFRDNGIGFGGYTASAYLLNNTFHDRTWDVHLDGVTGYVILRGGTIEKIHVAGGQTLDTDWGLLVGTTTAAAFLALLALTEPGRFLFAFLLARLWRPEPPLDHPRRRRILGFVEDHPGTHLRALGDALGIPRNPVAYHVQVLERSGHLQSRRRGLHRHIYPAGHDDPDPGPDPRRRILDLVGSSPGIPQAQVARRLGMSPQLLSHHLKGLEDAGMVRRQRQGARKTLYPVE